MTFEEKLEKSCFTAIYQKWNPKLKAKQLVAMVTWMEMNRIK